MLKRPKSKTVIFIFSSVLILSGCVEARQLEKLGLITAIGYDMERENTIKGTVVIHKFDAMAQNITKTISVSGHTSKELRLKLNLQTDQKLVQGQLRCVVYSRDIAEKGISQLLDTLNRDPNIGNLVYLTVSDGSAEKIIMLDRKGIKVNLGTYLYNLIQQNVQSELLPPPTLHEFNHSLHDIGKDPVLPILKRSDEGLAINGVALFKDDRFVSELKADKLFYLKILSEKYRSGTKELVFDRSGFKKILINKDVGSSPIFSKLFINIDNIRSNVKIDLVEKKNLLFKINVKLSSRLLETTEPLDLTTPDNIKFMEKKISQEMEKEIKKLLAFFQKQEVDPIGIGNEYITHIRGRKVSKEEARQIFKEAQFDVNVKNTLVKTGTID